MANIIQIKSGANASLPVLAAREFGFATDTHQVYIGDGAANHELAKVSHSASKTTAAWSKTIGATGDYATWAAVIADMPDLIAHAVTVTIQAGTTLTETCELKNKHGITKDGAITIQAEKYFPTSGAIPTADSTTATTLRDAALATAALGNDYFNGCWVFVIDGTGTDNGFVLITDYVDATGDVVVASWPGTQPDNTSRYMIVGALIDGENTRTYGFNSSGNSSSLYFYGIGVRQTNSYGLYNNVNTNIFLMYCGLGKNNKAAIQISRSLSGRINHCGFVENNVTDHAANAGIVLKFNNLVEIVNSGLSDNNRKGILSEGGNTVAEDNFGNGNGAWGSYAQYGANVRHVGTECSGSSGNHSDPGTAGNANADQAAAY